MLYLVLKIGISAFVLVAVSEFPKRSGTAGALLDSLPLTTLLALVWLWVDTGDAQKVAALGSDVFWLVLPSLVLLVLLPMLVLLVLLPMLLRLGLSFWPALGLSSLTTVASHVAMMVSMRRFRFES